MFIALNLLIFLSGCSCFGKEKIVLDEQEFRLLAAQKAVAVMQPLVGMKFENGTVLRGARLLEEGRTLTAIYEYEAPTTVVWTDEARSEQSKLLFNTYCGDEMKGFVAEDISAEWHYFQDGKVKVFSFSPKDCD